MKIQIRQVGRFKELGVCDFENEDVWAYSGLLDEDEAHDLAESLREAAQRLLPHANDTNQFLLPFARAA